MDESELDTLKERDAYFGIDKTKDFEDYSEKYMKGQSLVKNDKISIIISGGISGARNPFGEKAKEHAEKYYGLVRSMKTDVAKISMATGMTEEIQNVKDFIFNEKHDLSKCSFAYASTSTGTIFTKQSPTGSSGESSIDTETASISVRLEGAGIFSPSVLHDRKYPARQSTAISIASSSESPCVAK